MTGRNKIQLNDTTMIEVVQEWCERHFVTAPKVTAIRKVNISPGSISEMFEIDIEEKEPDHG